jgi:hypothetical protein
MLESGALGLVVFAAFVGGHALAQRVWELDAADPGAREGPAPMERALGAATLGVALLVAVSFALALPRWLTPATLVCASLSILVAAHRTLVTLGRSLVAPRASEALRPLVLVALALAPVVLWTAFVAFRSALAPVVNHDALAYHMPKALQIARAHGLGALDGPDARVSSFPAGYEILLADVILLTGSDALTEWVGTLFYLLFGLAAGALAERAWGRGGHVLVAVLLAMGMPIALLHAGAHKNDLMLGAFFLVAAVSGARWAAEGGRAPLVLTVVAVGLAVGTKVNGALVLAGLVPAFAWGSVARARAGDRPTLRDVAATAAVGLVAFLALGGVVYVSNVLSGRGLTGRIPGVGYGDWANVWMFPLLVFERPLLPNDGAVWIPWTASWWFWPRYDHYFSSYGVSFTALLAAVPLGVWCFRGLEVARRRERAFQALILLAAFAVILPVRMQRPVGFFEGLVRYTLFLPPLIALWTAVPLARACAMRSWRMGAVAVVAASSVVLAINAVASGLYDTYLPIDYVMGLLDHPELERSPYDVVGRAAHVVDTVAGPHDRIAFDGGFASFAYPAYGAGLTRQVTYLHAGDDGTVALGDDADWIVVDRAWNMLFGNPGFVDFGHWSQFFMRGAPAPEDTVVFDVASRDPRFRLVYRDVRTNQAVFKAVRRSPAAPPASP